MINAYLNENRILLEKTLEELTILAAPSFYEQARARYCLNWLTEQRIPNGFIDESGNVILSFLREHCEENRLFMAHLDTVFPENTKLKIAKKGSIWSCPGIGDDTANAVILLMVVKYLWEKESYKLNGMLFAWNVGEEGVGNLYGCRRIMEKYGSMLKSVISFDLYQKDIFNAAIGSIRYRIKVHTKGGHSYFDYGNRNAIVVMSEILMKLYEYKVVGPEESRITYNVGNINGGTSVNVIAQQCEILWEYRSDQKETLRKADEYLKRILDSYRGYADIAWEVIGERPCMGDVNQEIIDRMTKAVSDCIREVTGITPQIGEASTDCNIPMAMGIPALCVGLVRGGGAHTLEEWIDVDSLAEGIRIAVKLCGDKAVYFGTETEEYLFREKLTDREEQKEVYKILESCDDDFCPPLSQRHSTFQKDLWGEEKNMEGVDRYFHGLLEQNILLQKKNGRVVAFLSYRPDFVCEELSAYGAVYYLTTLCIRRDYRGLGYAPAIYHTLFEKIYKENPHAVVSLRTWSTNMAQIHLMEKMNFYCAARLKNHRGEGIDTLYFVKSLIEASPMGATSK